MLFSTYANIFESPSETAVVIKPDLMGKSACRTVLADRFTNVLFKQATKYYLLIAVDSLNYSPNFLRVLSSGEASGSEMLVKYWRVLQYLLSSTKCHFC